MTAYLIKLANVRGVLFPGTHATLLSGRAFYNLFGLLCQFMASVN